MANDAKVVVGRYQDPIEVRAALQRLEREGYAREDITLYTDKSNLDRIEETQDIETLSEEGNRIDGEHGTDRSFWERVRDMVSYDDPDDERERDSREEEFIAPFREDIRDGYTVIAVKNYIGNDGKEIESKQMNPDEDPEVVPPATATHVEQTDEIDARPSSQNETIQLKEEQINVKKEEVQTGEVEIHKETVHDTKTIEVPIEREQIVVERKSVGDAAGKVDSKADEDSDSFTIPIKEEKIIVEKEPVVTEEVEVRKERKEDIEHVTEDVRREEIDVDATGGVRRENTTTADEDVDADGRRR